MAGLWRHAVCLPVLMVSNFRRALQQVWQHIERFPIPIEDALWIVEAYGDRDAAEAILAQRDKRGSSFPDIREVPRHVSNRH
jgi:hypothetical protein